jgi:hypothetical protein
LLNFQVKCLPFKFGGVSSYVSSDLHRSFSIVFLDTLGTMCHFSWGVGQTFLFFYLIICVKKKFAMLLIEHELHYNCGLHVIGMFNLFEHNISLEISVILLMCWIRETSFV